MVSLQEIKINRVSQSKVTSVDFENIPFGRVYSDHMFIAEYVDGKWDNLRIEPYQDLQIAPGSAILHYAQSIFEGLKAYKSHSGDTLVFRPLSNYKRMNVSAERMCMPAITEEIFMGGMTELLKLDKAWVPGAPGTSLYIRPFMFANDEYIGIRPSDKYKFIIFTCPVGSYYSEPVKVKIEQHFSRAASGGTGSAKTGGNYAGSLFPAKKAQQEGYHQLIWTDSKEHRYIEEAGTMNIMFRMGKKILTAPTGETILHGITRDSVLTLARDMGYEVEERPITVDEIISAIQTNRLDEAFGTGTAATIAHIKTIGHEGVDFELPPVQGREFSNTILKTLDEIKYGQAEDKHNWVYKI